MFNYQEEINRIKSINQNDPRIKELTLLRAKKILGCQDIFDKPTIRWAKDILKKPSDLVLGREK